MRRAAARARLEQREAEERQRRAAGARRADARQARRAHAERRPARISAGACTRTASTEAGELRSDSADPRACDEAADRMKACVRLQAAGRRTLAQRQLIRLRAERARSRTTGAKDPTVAALEYLVEERRRLSDELSDLRNAHISAVGQIANLNTQVATLATHVATVAEGLMCVAREVRRTKVHGEASGCGLRIKRSCVSRDTTVATVDAHTSTAVSGSSLAQLVATLASPRWQRASEPVSRRSGGRQRRRTRQARIRQAVTSHFE